MESNYSKLADEITYTNFIFCSRHSKSFTFKTCIITLQFKHVSCSKTLRFYENNILSYTHLCNCSVPVTGKRVSQRP